MARRRGSTEGPHWPPGEYAGLTDFHFALIIVCGAFDAGVSAYEIELLIETGRGGVLGRSAAHVYKEIKVLAEREYLKVEQTPGPKGARIYHITPKGRDAAQLWVERAPIDLPATDDSVAFILILASRLVARESVWKSLLKLWDQIDQRLVDLDEVERRLRHERHDRQLPQNVRLEHSLVRGLLGAYETWLTEAQREWEMPDPRDT